MIASPTLLALLRLPGDIPHLLRCCSPVIHNGRRRIVHTIGVSGLVSLSMAFVELKDLKLDLTEATGRDHAARWLARHFGHVDAVRAATIVWEHGKWWLAVYHNTGRTRHALNLPVEFDATNEHCLPDGSRWQDADILRVAVRHYAPVRES